MSFVFSQVWDAAFEGQPPDTQNLNLGAGKIRELKVDISQRMKIDHQWAGNAFDGKHLRVTLPDGFPGSPDAGDGVVYAAGSGGITELCYRDSVGHSIQLTSNGGLNVPSSFPAGTRLGFANAAPPPGWIQITGAHDHVIRMVDDSSGGVGGGINWNISGIAVSTSTSTGTTTSTTTSTTTTTGTTVGITGGIGVDNHTLTLAEIPPITLNSDYPIFTGTLNSSGSNSSSLITGTTTHSTSTVGGGGGHSHTVSNTLGATASSTSSSTSTSSSVSTSTSSSLSSASQDGSWRPPYVNFCMGHKT